jgi:murein DD-endopeptidase MepM/ murein hydrolase activator NlpD
LATAGPATSRACRALAVAALLLGSTACMRGRLVVTPLPAPVDTAAPGPPATPAVAPPPAASSRATVNGGLSLIVPVKGVHPSLVRDTYTASRGARTHNALDIMAPRGTPVLAAADGTVYRLRSNAAGGITIYQRDASEQYIFYYAHLERYRSGLREGDHLRQGDVIGYVGTTGNAPPNVPHLHFQVMKYRRDGRYWDGEPVNPHPMLVAPGGMR